jgi:uncharacterized protein YgiM (DUF1202 family)
MKTDKPSLIARVIRDYITPFADPLIISTGEELTIIPKESEWPGWIWCVNKNGKEGWVPECCIKINGPIGRVLNNYDAHELNVRSGEELTVIRELYGWIWCLNQKNESGWVPLDNVEILKKSTIKERSHIKKVDSNS